MPDQTTQMAIPVAGGRTIQAALAQPEPDGASLAGVIVIHEALGLNDDMRRIARRFAEHGYTALAPDLLGIGWKPVCIARFMQGIGKVGTGRPYRDVGAAQRWLAMQEGVDPDRIGIVGFCMGGGFALSYAARGPERVQVVAPFYPAVPKDEVVAELCPTVASFGGRDRIFARGASRLDAGLERQGVDRDVKVYPDAGHGFMSHHGPWLTRLERMLPQGGGYHEEAAEDAWARMIAFFDRHLSDGQGPPRSRRSG